MRAKRRPGRRTGHGKAAAGDSLDDRGHLLRYQAGSGGHTVRRHTTHRHAASNPKSGSGHNARRHTAHGKAGSGHNANRRAASHTATANTAETDTATAGAAAADTAATNAIAPGPTGPTGL